MGAVGPLTRSPSSGGFLRRRPRVSSWQLTVSRAWVASWSHLPCPPCCLACRILISSLESVTCTWLSVSSHPGLCSSGCISPLVEVALPECVCRGHRRASDALPSPWRVSASEAVGEQFVLSSAFPHVVAAPSNVPLCLDSARRQSSIDGIAIMSVYSCSTAW